ALVSGVDYVQAQRRRRELCAATAAAMADVDLLLTTAAPTEAPRIDAVTKWGSMEKPGFTMLFDVTGQPAISLCSGFGEGGMPVSIQLAGRPFEDALLLRAAHAYEQATPWRGMRPPLVG
ncbi:MAG: amidase, partial [Rhodospirillales bacterium]|nr:amidase [Rhodospirillales bacterium]